MSQRIRPATHADKEDWLRLRQALWPYAPADYLAVDMDDRLGDPDSAIFLVSNPDGRMVAFLEARLREYAEGCETSPVGYIEAWYVEELSRGQHYGRELVQAAEEWAREKGCQEMASDTWTDNEPGIQAHLRLGYQEADRLVHFVKRL
ncbi:MAG TPA: aminoglycoside 6'-N-acetyltransferase [Anaerolineales bacterium]|nr:aminoglycoside 6'-N-acetyltransferase [Anaerolineales bacterium]